MVLQDKFEGKGEVKGYLFTKIMEGEYAFLYEVRHKAQIHYEVFKRKEKSVGVWENGKATGKRRKYLAYPTSNAFGEWAWTCMSLGKAKDKFNEINRVSCFKGQSEPLGLT